MLGDCLLLSVGSGCKLKPLGSALPVFGRLTAKGVPVVFL